MQRSIGTVRRDSSAANGASGSDIAEELDVLIVGAGFAGCYLIHNLRQHNFKTKIVEAGDDIGGVWHWNRYPGARVDSQYPVYQLSIPEIWKDWYWKEKYPGADELRDYFAHIEKVLSIKKDCELNTKVDAAEFDAATNKWTVHYNTGKVVRTRFFIAAIGFAARRFFPDWKGFEKFQGVIHHSSFWPMDGVDVRGKRLAVVGTGATGVQIAQACAKQIGESGSLTVFQRTPNIACPMRQAPLTKAEQDHDKQNYNDFFEKRLMTVGGYLYGPTMKKALDSTEAEREAFFEKLWEEGGFAPLLKNYYDILLDPKANRNMYDFWAKKVRARINDPKAKDLLAPLEPPHVFGGKRPSLEQDFYEQFNRPNVHIVSTKETPVREIDERGIITSDGKLHEFDIIALATGFDAVTGGIKDIKLRGINGDLLTDHWKNGTYTYLGMTVDGFPNLMMLYGPQSPTAFSNGPSCVEPQADWILKVLLDMRAKDLTRIDATADAASNWKQEVLTLSQGSLRHGVDGWYNGGNIPGKVKEPMNYSGGLPNYIKTLDDTLANDYRGFELQ